VVAKILEALATPRTRSPVGYQALKDRFGIKAMPLVHTSFLHSGGGMRTEVESGQTVRHFPRSYTPADTVPAHLEFALKYDGVNLEVLRAVFERVHVGELAAWIRATPTGKYTRRLWFLYEWLTGRTLDVPDAQAVGYVDALGDAYFGAAPRLSQRHRVRDDLPGSRAFCPLVRRTPTLAAFVERELHRRVRAIVAPYDAALLNRVAQFLYLKETKSSFEIEREQPERHRTLRFVELLRSTNTLGELTTARLVELQRAILDARYAQDGYRRVQNYVGQTLTSYREQIHYVSPRPQDLGELMDGWLACSARLAASAVDPVVQAAALGFGFVYVHPFDDGNGRLHRYVIHHVLSRSGFTPPGLVLPVSAVMLQNPAAYDACLEAFSRPLLSLLDYSLDARGALTVHTDSAAFYRYFDATPAAEYLYAAVERAIDVDLQGEIDFLVRYDAAWHKLREIVDMPNRRLELFMKLCIANQGRLAKGKRGQFPELRDDEIQRMEEVLRIADQTPG
jgi:hypothetical protein